MHTTWHERNAQAKGERERVEKGKKIQKYRSKNQKYDRNLQKYTATQRRRNGEK